MMNSFATMSTIPVSQVGLKNVHLGDKKITYTGPTDLDFAFWKGFFKIIFLKSVIFLVKIYRFWLKILK